MFGRDAKYRKRLVSASLALAVPGLAAVAVLTATGEMSPWAGALVAAALLAGIAGGLFMHFRHMVGIERYIRRLRGPGFEARTLPEPPSWGSGFLAPGLRQTIAETAQERQRRRRELTAAISSNEKVLGALPDPLLMLDRDRRVVRANPPARQLYGARIAGRDLTAVVRNPDLLTAVDEALQNGRSRTVDFTQPGTMDVYLSARVEPLPETTPEGIAVLVSLHDLTGMKRAEQMRADFVANASHELRTPLSSLLGFIETLKGPAREDEAARERFLSIMLEQAERMQRLIEDLLSLSRIELDEHSPPTGKCDLVRVLESATSLLGPQAEAKNIAINLDLRCSAEVAGDKDQLVQVFQNLLENAIKYGREDTKVTVLMQRADRLESRAAKRMGGQGVAVSVIDNGEGIPREHLPRLTERFYRVDAARSRALGGTGLGLAIVKHIVNRHRGALEVESTPGEGSTFTVFLPGQTQETVNRRPATAAE